MRDDLDHDYDLDGPPGEPRSAIPLLSAWGGGLAALAALGAVGWWAWTVTAQDAADVPVIAAMAGVVRERPSDAGEALTPNRDIASYEAGQGGEAAATPGYAPPPARPTDEDLAIRDIEALLGLREADPEAVADARADEEMGVPAEIPGAEQTAALPSGPTPPEGVGSERAPAIVPGAPARPVHLARRMRAASEEAVQETVRLAEAAAASRWQIQLGAFRDPRITREEWQLISGTHASLLQGRALAVQETVSGGETFYRLRVGPFESEAEASNLCEALLARGQTCITAENR
jgi:hypothetical protein